MYSIWNQERKTLSKRANSQVTELQSFAEEHFNRANRLDGELSRMRKDKKDLKRQVSSTTLFDLITNCIGVCVSYQSTHHNKTIILNLKFQILNLEWSFWAFVEIVLVCWVQQLKKECLISSFIKIFSFLVCFRDCFACF